MKSVVIHAAHDLRVDMIEDAPPPASGELRVRVARGGICGSDLHYYHQGGPGAIRIKSPMVLGHEASGIVDVVGEGVDGFQPGDKVAINPSMPCKVCDMCQRGMRQHCRDMRFCGSAMRFPHQQGLFREAVTMPQEQFIRLHPETDLAHAACAEPFAVCLHAVEQAGPLLGRRVLVSGCGPIGCLTILAAARAGAAEIIATDLGPAPLAIAERMGATQTIDVASDAAALEPLMADRGTIDVVFDCSGSAAALQGACAFLRPRGILVCVGMGADAALPMGLIVPKELQIVGTFRFDLEFATAIALIDSGKADVSPLVTQILPLSKMLEAFDLAGDRSSAMKVQIDFEQA